MSRTLPSRKKARADLVAKIKAGITQLADAGGVAHTYDHLIKDPAGLSPICTVESGPWQPRFTAAETQTFAFTIGLWVKRTDASDAEDLLDDLAVDLAEVLDANYNAEFTRPSMPEYDLPELQYRIEWHFVAVEWLTT